MNLNKSLSEKGQTIMEIIFAMGLAAVVLVVLVSTITAALRDARVAKNQSLAAKYAQEGLEALRTIRQNNFADLNTYKTDCNKTASAYLYQVSSEWRLRAGPYDQFVNQTSNGVFARVVYVVPVYRNAGNITGCGDVGSTIDTNSYQVYVQINWKESSGDQKTEVSTVLTNPIARPN